MVFYNSAAGNGGGTLVDQRWYCTSGTLLGWYTGGLVVELYHWYNVAPFWYRAYPSPAYPSNQLVETNVEPNANTKAETFLPPERSRTNCFGVEIDGQYLRLLFA